MISPLLFVVCFMFLAVLLLLGVIYSRVHWIPKAILVLISLLFGGVFYQGYLASLGYPAPITVPAMFRFVYAYVREPYPLKGDSGAIYIWMLTPGNEVPRVMSVPYSDKTRKMIGEAKKKAERGEIVYLGLAGNGKSSDGGGKASSSDPGSGSTHKSSMGPKSLPYDVKNEETLEFKAPPDTVPRKDST